LHVDPVASLPWFARHRAANDLARTSYHDLASWRDAAGSALQASAQASPYDTAEWLERTVRLSRRADRPLVLSADDQAWLPLTRDGVGQARALASWYTLAFRPIFALPSFKRVRTMVALASAARREGLGRIVLSPVPEWDGSARLLADGFRRAGWIVRVEEATGNWVHRVSGDGWDEYFASRPGTLRSTIRRKSKRNDLSVTRHRTLDPALWADYVAVFAGSWKGEEGSLPFLRDWMGAAARQDRLRLGFAHHGNRPVAAQFWTIDGDTATIHKLAYREDARALSPGTVLGAAMFRAAIEEDRVALIDYGTGDDGYKREWMSERRPLMRVTLSDPRAPVGALLLARDAAARLVARRLSSAGADVTG